MTRKKGFTVEQDGSITDDQGSFSDQIQKVVEAVVSDDNAIGSITIKKAKIKNNLFLEVEYSEKQKDGTNTVKKDCTAPVHDDLKLAFKKLVPHLAVVCGQTHIASGKSATSVAIAFPEEELKWQLDPDENFAFTLGGWELVSKHFIVGFSIGGSGDSEGVTLTGYRELKNEKVLNLVSPFTKWDDDYELASELGEVIEECKSEVKKYLFEGKHQPDVQGDLFAQEDQDDPLLK